jgi:hypothetical protein
VFYSKLMKNNLSGTTFNITPKIPPSRYLVVFSLVLISIFIFW